MNKPASIPSKLMPEPPALNQVKDEIPEFVELSQLILAQKAATEVPHKPARSGLRARSRWPCGR